MTVRVLIPTALRAHCDGNKHAQVSGQNVGEALDALAARHPALRSQLFEPSGELRSFVNVFVGDRNIRDLQFLESLLAEGDQISLVPAIAGG